ncbi:hypothetical protein DL96DRAFT_97655 [Flagelloscypha sp. PMI_526]|nr:hypothetical protein DL96DRAFT_97655 [Flagelloscypha sp. PMI_526]
MSVRLLTLNALVPRAGGVYNVGLGFLFGMSTWVTFFGGIIAFKTLPRQQFGALQHKTFPIYFKLSSALTAGLLAYWTWTHPDVQSYPLDPRVADTAQAWALGSVLVDQAVNLLVIGPMTSHTMFQRHKLEKEEGKSYNEPGVSDKMKALNKKFGMLHGISSLLNLGAVLGLLAHSLWVGSYGVV